MANTLTNLIPDIYERLDTVSRELVGAIPAVSRDSGAERAAVNEDIRSHVAPASTAADITPSTDAPDTGDQTIGSKTMTISKARAVPVRSTGEEQKGLNNGAGYRNVLMDQFEQAFRTLTNEVETDLMTDIYQNASQAYGTAGTTPFASNLSDPAEIRKILSDNGAPLSDMQMVIDTAAGAKMRTLAQLTKANEAADASLLRQGVLLDIHGFAIRESGQAQSHTGGTGASATTDATGYAIGATTITLASAGTGSILEDDFVSFAGDSRKYRVTSGDADVSGGGTITIEAPGLQKAIPTSATAITVAGSYTGNVAFDRRAVHLATRVPARPEEGDKAIDVEIVVDERSGLAFEVAIYPEYRRVHYEVSLAWGYKVFKPEHTAVLLG